ncbi:MAG: hypothetical protein ACI9R3_005135 [Verrucomicrobiales bacterium]|jgi:hypothetical protein
MTLLQNLLMMNRSLNVLAAIVLTGLVGPLAVQPAMGQGLPVNEGDRICLVGNSMAMGIAEAGFWETLMQTRWTDAELSVRCFGNEGNAMQFDAIPDGYESQDAALHEWKANTIFVALAPGDIAPANTVLKPSLDKWLKHVLAQKYDGFEPPSVILISPTPCENTGDPALSKRFGTGNALRQSYAVVMKEVAAANGVGFIDAFALLTSEFLDSGKKHFTTNATDLSTEGNKALGAMMDFYSFGAHPNREMTVEQARAVKAAVLEKNAFFENVRDWMKKAGVATGAQKQGFAALLSNRDQRIWGFAQGQELSATIDDSNVGNADSLKSLLSKDSAATASIEPLRGYSIPLLDLDAHSQRQVVVDREEGQYLGHPTTVLLEDHQSMLCVYPKGHGRGGIVYKRSNDAGMTWSDRLPTPESWATSREVPTLHRVVDAEGVKRLIMFSGLYPARMAVSEDDGANWSDLAPVGDWGGIVVMGNVTALNEPGHYMAMFHDDGRFFKEGGKLANPVTFQLLTTFSSDGGLTWSQPGEIWKGSDIHLCEPGAIRSPDGKQIAVLLRENRRTRNSFVIFSDDEGRSWTEPRELPGSLTGDRHTGQYAPDGRLFISFRDMAHDSPTKGDWVGWVGTYEDIVAGTEGQYRVRLKDNHKASDCAYPGVEILPDGTFVTTTYGHWEAGKQPYILSVRFTLKELDQIAAAQ